MLLTLQSEGFPCLRCAPRDALQYENVDVEESGEKDKDRSDNRVRGAHVRQYGTAIPPIVNTLPRLLPFHYSEYRGFMP